MEPVITVAESRRLDDEAPEALDVLMERAGHAVALGAVGMGARYGARVAVLAGKGNNGGDGYVAARLLHGRGVGVTVHAFGEPDPDTPAGRARARALAEGVRVVPAGEPPSRFDLLIDALFGVGFRGLLPDQMTSWTGLDIPVLSVDLPSGCDATSGMVEGPAFTAQETITFQARKLGHVLGEGPERSGRVTVVDIGLPAPRPEFGIVTSADALRPARPRTAHKWSAGSVLVVGGAPGMSGAALLAAKAALRFGAGAVRLVVPASVVERVAAAAPEIMVSSSRDERFELVDAADVAAAGDRFDVLVVGPGLGGGADAFVRSLLDQWEGPRVVDADALGAFVSPGRLGGQETVITPHAGEWRRLTGTAPDHRAVLEWRGETGPVVLLKGSPTFVVGESVAAVTSGGPELATIGTGDVLAGMVGALVARGLEPELAARSAAYWHGVAGADLAAQGSVTADALLDVVGRWAS